MEIVFLAGAQADVQAAFEGFGGPEGKRAGLFLQRLNHTLTLLRENPAMAPHYGGQFRRLILRGFSQAVFYAQTGERIFIVAVMDLRQNPERLRQRLGLS